MISSHILEELGKLANSYGIIHEGHLLDEFTTGDYTKRAGKYVTVKTSGNEKAVEALKKGGFGDISIDNDHNIRINGALDQTEKIAKTVVDAGIGLKELIITNTSLEDYYLSVTGGKHNG